MTYQTYRTPLGVWALAITAFAIGVAEFIVVGVLQAIADDLNVPLARAGSLVGLYALALAIGTPLVVLSLARLPRKPVLLMLVTVFLAGNLISALSASYEGLLVGRGITAVAHGSFFAIGATVAARMVPSGQASRAISLMFAGLTLAMVLGVPLGSAIGNAMGWRLPFYAVAALGMVALLATAKWVPSLPASTAGLAKVQLEALRKGPVLAMMSITILGFGASFSVFTFITSILTTITGFTSTMASLMLMVFGMATLVGNLLGGRVAVSFGWMGALRYILGALSITLIGLAILMPYKVPMVVVLFVWGLLAFGMSPACQTGMLSTAERWTPKAVDFASALNISGFNLGISLGESVGSAMVAREHIASTPWASFALVLLAFVPLAWLSRRVSERTHSCDEAVA